jgi:hypothetical protein
MNTWKKIVLLAVVFALSGFYSLLAHEHQMPAPKSDSKEFEQLKQLAGAWKGTKNPSDKDQKPEPVSIHFKVTAAGSAVEETLMQGTPHEMVDMYTDENGKLTMTHYCAIGNQPHMLLKPSGPNQISLAMGPTPGIDSDKDQHMHALILEFPDANHLTEKWTSYQDGKPGETVVFTLARVPSK